MTIKWTDAEFSVLTDLLEDEFGLSLKNHTAETFASKIKPRLQALKMTSMKEYLHFLKSDPMSKLELHDLPGFIMNTESYFLREFPQFDIFLNLFREKFKQTSSITGRQVRVLSAGCADGQEPASIAMLLSNEYHSSAGYGAAIFGLDINHISLENAEKGIYSPYSFRSPKRELIMKYFSIPDRDICKTYGECFMLDPDIATSIEYIHGNIMHPLVLKGLLNLDFIFCRNLLMYMSERASEKILFNLWEALTDDGYLFIGQSESPSRMTNYFDKVRFPEATVYKKKNLKSKRQTPQAT